MRIRTFHDVAEFIKAHQPGPDIGDHDVFVLNSPDQVTDNHFSIVISTRNLLQNAFRQQSIMRSFVAADSTYKVVWNGFPLHVIGTVDIQQSFHLIAIALASHENNPSYSEFFEAVRSGVEVAGEQKWSCQYAMSDNSMALKNAFIQSLGIDHMGNCWAHLQRGLRKWSGSIQKKANLKLIQQDLFGMHDLHRQEEFRAAVRLWKTQWINKGEEEFVERWSKQWLDGVHGLWSQATSIPGIPTTNNALESFNRQIKDTLTLGNIPSMSEFLRSSLLWMEGASKSEVSQFPEDPLAEESSTKSHVKKRIADVWMSARVWAAGREDRLSKHREIVLDDLVVLAYAKEVLEDEDVKEDIDGFLDQLEPYDNEDFDRYMSRRESCVLLQRRQDGESELVKWSCSCKQYQHYVVCRHSLGLSIALNGVKIPGKHRSRQLGSRRKPGRPRKSTPALCR